MNDGVLNRAQKMAEGSDPCQLHQVNILLWCMPTTQGGVDKYAHSKQTPQSIYVPSLNVQSLHCEGTCILVCNICLKEQNRGSFYVRHVWQGVHALLCTTEEGTIGVKIYCWFENSVPCTVYSVLYMFKNVPPLVFHVRVC